MKSTLYDVLKNRNGHDRDQYIKFYEEGHKYEILLDLDSKYTSVTTWNHSHFPKFDADKIISSMMKGKNWNINHKYWGLSPEEIKAKWDDNKNSVAGAGTDMHYEIECFMNNNYFQSNFEYTHKDLYDFYNYSIDKEEHINKPIEWQYFIEFVKNTPHLKPYRTEWMVYDEDVKLSGSIDMVYENPDGTLDIYDWKRAKEINYINNWNKTAINPLINHLPDTNFWHYSLQLNTYKKILENKYGKKITNLNLIKLHPENTTNTYEILEVPILNKELSDLFQERKMQQIEI